MKLPVYLYGHPVLRKVSEDITPDYPELKKLLDNMYETMYASEGVGLAAPQIGRNDRIVVIDADPVAETFPECAGRKLTLINPEVEVLEGESVTRGEGCLSLPGLSENVSRVEHIRLRWVDENFEQHEEDLLRLQLTLQHTNFQLSSQYQQKIFSMLRILVLRLKSQLLKH